MGYTGRLGIGKSRLGNILLGVVDTLGEGTFNYQVHQIEPDKIRVKFATRINVDSATEVSKYTLTLINPANAFSITPSIIFVKVYDSTETSVVLQLSNNLSTEADYSLSIGEIFDVFGDTVSFVTRNFTANAIIPPLALGSYLSKASHADVVFNRNVGPNSVGATFSLQTEDGVTTIPVTQVTWATAGISQTTIRLNLEAISPIPTADGYVILYQDVIDDSGNEGSGSIPLTLVLRTGQPYSSASIAQIQITDAYVSDVSNDLIDTAVVRVYLSGPVTNGGNTANWGVQAIAPHKNTDTLNTILIADASDLLSLVILLNGIKSQFNKHIIQDQVHFVDDASNTVTQSDAVSLPGAITLANQIQEKFLLHLSKSNVHAYPDEFNDFSSLVINSQPSAIIFANLVKSRFNAHILPSYPVSFSTSYPAVIGPITARSSYVSNTIYPTISPYTSYVDLRLNMTSVRSRLLITATLQSEDNITTTNPLDITGSITARSLHDTSIDVSVLPLSNRGVNVVFDKNIYIPRNHTITVTNGDGFEIETELSATGTEQAAAWALNNLTFAYSKHIDSSNGAIHFLNDTTNIIYDADYVVTLSLAESILKANTLKDKINLHISTSSFHFNPDTDLVRAQPASDLKTLVNLIDDMRNTFIRHNSRIGVHSGVGARIISAKLFDILEIRTNFVQTGLTHEISGLIRGYYFNNAKNESIYSNRIVENSFLGVADRPSLASVIPKLGLLKLEDGVGFESDSIELYFTKPMAKVDLDPGTVLITGGSILLKKNSWLNEQVASIEVSRMETVSYDLTVSNITDTSGNPIS